MKSRFIGVAVLALALTAGMAGARDIPTGGMTADDVASWLHSKGYKAEISKADNGRPKIASATQGINFYVHFYDCKNDRCASIQFVAGFSTNGAYSLQKANDWNNDNRWITASMDKENDPWISMDVDLWPGGTYELLNDELQVWDDSVARFVRSIKPQ
jgi:hypothetical protein